jgi:D-3-phosphoglycerate dehydrogenase
MTVPSKLAADPIPNVAVVANSFNDPDRIAAHFGESCILSDADLGTPESVARATAHSDAVVVTTQPLTAAHLAAFGPNVRVIGRAGVGLDSIDVEAVRSLGLTLINQPSYGSFEVASHAVGLIIALQRKIPLADRYVRDGWSGALQLAPMKPLDELTLGLVGCGRIGAETVRLLGPMVAEVLIYDPFVADLPPGSTRLDDLSELLSRSEVLSVHAPLTDDTRGLLGLRELGLLPAGAVVVNVARGGIIDEDALAGLLTNGHLAGAGLDVFATEPLAADSPLLTAPNTLLTPHCAAYSERATWRLASWTIGDVLSWLASRTAVHGNVVVSGR